MNQIQEIQRLLAVTTPSSGTVIRIESNGLAAISTRTGMLYLPISTNTKIRQGDTVAIRNNAVVGKTKSESEIPHFVV